MKRLLALLCLSGLVLMLAGCGGGGGGGDDAEIQEAIAARIHSFKTAVEAYDVDGMLAFLDENDFILTITENGSSYQKTYAVLAGELAADEAKQLHWRAAVPDGHGYVLAMELGAVAFENLSAAGGMATVPFTIKEKAADIPEMVTDTGSMVCEMASLAGVWRCQRLAIHFNPAKACTNRAAAPGGFGFGRLDPGGI